MLRSLGEIKYLTETQVYWVYDYIFRIYDHEGEKEEIINEFKRLLKELWGKS